jgi:hypothetical protein
MPLTLLPCRPGWQNSSSGSSRLLLDAIDAAICYCGRYGYCAPLFHLTFSSVGSVHLTPKHILGVVSWVWGSAEKLQVNHGDLILFNLAVL